MDNQNYKDLALLARELYKISDSMQKLMLRMFFDEFIEIDQDESRKQSLSESASQF